MLVTSEIANQKARFVVYTNSTYPLLSGIKHVAHKKILKLIQ